MAWRAPICAARLRRSSPQIMPGGAGGGLEIRTTAGAFPIAALGEDLSSLEDGRFVPGELAVAIW